MRAMQYKIALPLDYDMNNIRKRVKDNGFKTDGFTDLLCKAYLILDTKTKKEYAPLYIWKHDKGMNTFIFDGFFDNILHSFGWQHIHIAVPIQIDVSETMKQANYVLEIEHDITVTNKMSLPTLSLNHLLV